jgi:putative ABC transport system permease protein
VSSAPLHQRWRQALVVFEIAVTVALLVVTTAIVSAYRRMLSSDLGYDTRTLVVARVERPGGVSIQPTLDAIRRMPGVTHVAASTAVPVVSGAATRAIGAERAAANRVPAGYSLVGSGFFEALGVPVLKGRAFSDQDMADGVRIAIVNEALAARLWPRQQQGEEALGASLWIDDERHQVVGIVKTYLNAPLNRPQPSIFVPLRQSAAAERLQFLIRTTGSPAAAVGPIRTAIRELDAQNRAVSVFPVDIVKSIGGQEMLATVFPMAPLIATGLLLVAAGIYGVLTFAITRRAHELAIRLAIGASHADLLRLVLQQSARLVASGAFVGIGLTFALTRFMQGRGGVFDSPGLSTFLVPFVVIAVVGAVATLGPFRRALRVSPISLLRSP